MVARKVIARATFAFIALAIIGWILTGGIAIQRVERFAALSGTAISRDEWLRPRLVGVARSYHIPLLLRYDTSKGPFRFEFMYTSREEVPYTELRVKSLELTREGLSIVHVDLEKGIVLPLVEERIVNSTPAGSISTNWRMATCRIDAPIDVPFVEHSTIDFNIVIELAGNTGTRMMKCAQTLSGVRVDYTKSYWMHLLDA